MKKTIENQPLNAKAREFFWARMPEREFFALRVRELDLTVDDAGFSPFVNQLHRELQRRGLRYFRPHVYLGDEWFTPGGAASIAVPFYLAHPRLLRLERRYGKRVEGDNPAWFMRLLRHEAGHAFDHAYGVSDSSEWKRLFGDIDLPYNTERYRFDPSSRDFVVHLEDHYAQAHPEEDFAETFAVFITPGLNWRGRYKNWPGALRKLKYVERMVARYADKHPRKDALEIEAFPVGRFRRTLGRHYGLSELH